MLAQNSAQPRLEEMRGRVITHSGFANCGVDDGIHFLPNAEGAPPFRALCGGWVLYYHLMRPYSLDRVVASSHFGDDSVVIVGIEPPAIADLSAGLGVKGSVIEDDLAGFAGLEFLRALTALNDGQHFAVLGSSLAIAFEGGLWELLVGRIRRLLFCAFPGGASSLALLGHSRVEPGLIEGNPAITSGINHEVER